MFEYLCKILKIGEPNKHKVDKHAHCVCFYEPTRPRTTRGLGVLSLWLAGLVCFSFMVVFWSCNKVSDPFDPDEENGGENNQETPCTPVMSEWNQIWKMHVEQANIHGLTPDTNITDIWGAAKNDTYAVGFNGTILHYDGDSWTPMDSGTDFDLEGVWGYVLYDEQGQVTRTDVFAVGSHGTILRYDGIAWESQPVINDPDPDSPDPQNVTDSFHDVWGVAASGPNPEQQPVVMAVGADGLIVRWASEFMEFREMRKAETFEYPCETGTCTRTRYTRWTPERLGGVFGTSPSLFVAVGNNGTILEFNGSDWQRIIIPGFTTHLNGVWGRGSYEIFAVGVYGTIMRRGGNGTWEDLKILAASQGGHVQIGPVYLRSAWAFYQSKCGPVPEGGTEPTDTSWGFFVGWDNTLYLLHDQLICPFGQLDIQRFEGVWGTSPRSESERTPPDGGEIECDPVDVIITGVNGTIIRLINKEGR